MTTSVRARRGRGPFIYLSALIIAGLLTASDAWAVEDGQSAQEVPNAISFFTDDAAAFQPGGAAQQLQQRARAQGRVRVIVGLRIVTRMEHTLSPEQLNQQREAQRQVEDAIIRRVFLSLAIPRVNRFEFIPYMSMFVTAEQLDRLLVDPQVASLYEDVPVAPALAQSTRLIHAQEVWARGASGTDYVVAVLDTGVSATHPMINGKVVSEACYSTNDPDFGLRSVCPGGVESSTAKGSGRNCPVAIKGCDHGTHVASIAAGSSKLLEGVAPDSDIIAVQVFTRKTATNSITSFTTDIIDGLQRVYALRTRFKIAAVNMSLGGVGKYDTACDTNPAKAAIDNLRAVGIPTIIASGNNGYTGFVSEPACISTAIAVGNSTKSDLIWKNSNHSALVKLMAPGTSINAAVPGGGYDTKTGTSQAAPHVAGAFSVLKSAKPKSTLNDILAALSCTGKIVHERFVQSGNPVEVAPAKPRIDLLGAYNYLRTPRQFARTWNFGQSDDALDFTPLRGNWGVRDGYYTPTPIGTQWMASSVDNCDKSLEIIAKMTRVDPGTTIFSNSGIFFKTTVDYQNKKASGYFVGYNKCRTDSYGVCKDKPEYPPGQAVVLKVNEVNFETSGCACLSYCKEQATVNVNAPNTIKVVSKGSVHEYYLNGKLVCTFNDSQFLPGPVIPMAWIPPQKAGHSFKLDSLSIRALDTTASDENVEEVMDPTLAPKSIPPGMTAAGSSPMGAAVSGD